MAGIDDKEVMNTFKGFIFGSFGAFLKGVSFLASRWDENHKFNKQNKIAKLSGETNYFKMLNSNQRLDSKLLKSDVDVERLKKWFKDRNLPFSINKLKNGNKEFVFRVNDERMAQKGLEFILNEALKHPKRFAKAVLKNPNRRTLDEKIEAAKVTQAYFKSKGPIQTKGQGHVKAPKRKAR